MRRSLFKLTSDTRRHRSTPGPITQAFSCWRSNQRVVIILTLICCHTSHVSCCHTDSQSRWCRDKRWTIFCEQHIL